MVRQVYGLACGKNVLTELNSRSGGYALPSYNTVQKQVFSSWSDQQTSSTEKQCEVKNVFKIFILCFSIFPKYLAWYI